jgi:Domain of unknown function (DUF4381)
MDQPLKDFRLMEPILPEAPGPGLVPWIVGLLVLGAILMALVIWARQRHSPSHSLRFKELAYRNAVETLTRIAPVGIRETAIQSSLILRQFLAQVTNDPALYETHEEFITRQNSLQSLRPETQSTAKQLFDRLAAIKYASEVPDHQPSELIANSKSLLTTLHKELVG